MELNGLANIHAFLSGLKQDGKLSEDDFNVLENQIFIFRNYLHLLQDSPSFPWSTFITLQAYMTLPNEFLPNDVTEFSTRGCGIDLQEIGFKPKKDEE
jgi:hypothetical protein